MGEEIEGGMQHVRRKGYQRCIGLVSGIYMHGPAGAGSIRARCFTDDGFGSRPSLLGTYWVDEMARQAGTASRQEESKLDED